MVQESTIRSYEAVMKSDRIEVNLRVSNVKKQEIEDLFGESVMLPKKDHSPRPGGTFQRQNPQMARRAS